MAPVRAKIASNSVVLPLWKGPTSATHRGPRGLLTSCPIAASSSWSSALDWVGALMLRPSRRFGKQENVAAVHRWVCMLKPLPVLYGERSELARKRELRVRGEAQCQLLFLNPGIEPLTIADASHRRSSYIKDGGRRPPMPSPRKSGAREKRQKRYR